MYQLNLTKVILINLVILSLLNAKVIRHTFKISYITGSPDGVWTSHILGINGKFPGPTIEGRQGDLLRIKVLNRIQDGQNVSIHWHGIHQRGTPFEDGASHLTQCPLKKGSHQTYQFYLDQPGTYWYHSHVNSQYTEGLWGILIVHPTIPNPIPEIILTVSDWYHKSAHENEKWLWTPEYQGVPPFPSSILFNGMGRFPCPKISQFRRLCSIKRQRRPVFYVDKEKYYKIRLINTSGYAAFNFTIEGHNLTIIEVDGVDVQNVTTEALEISTGQRYTFLVYTNQHHNKSNLNGNRFLIRANLKQEYLFTIPNLNVNKIPEVSFMEVTAVIEYLTNSSLKRSSFEIYDYKAKLPEYLNWSNLNFLREVDLKALDGQIAPKYFDKQVVLNISFINDKNGIRRGTFNNIPFHFALGTMDEPLLNRMVYQNISSTNPTLVFTKFGDVIQVVVNNPMLGAHPIHLHGHHFWVMGQGGKGEGPFDPKIHKLQNSGYRRDTILVKEESWLVIRFTADNVGIWSLHCHVDWHYITGMGIVFVEGSDLVHQLRVPDQSQRICNEHYN